MKTARAAGGAQATTRVMCSRVMHARKSPESVTTSGYECSSLHNEINVETLGLSSPNIRLSESGISPGDTDQLYLHTTMDYGMVAHQKVSSDISLQAMNVCAKRALAFLCSVAPLECCALSKSVNCFTRVRDRSRGIFQPWTNNSAVSYLTM